MFKTKKISTRLGASLLVLCFTIITVSSCKEKCNTCPTYKSSKGHKKQKALGYIQPAPEKKAPATTKSEEKYKIAESSIRTKRDRASDAKERAMMVQKKEMVALEVESMDYEEEDGIMSESIPIQNPTSQPDMLKEVESNTESYDAVVENQFLKAKEKPLSTFSIDVDNASYTNCRRFINQGTMPPKDAVRIEEFINYFSYNYEEPSGKHPFSINTEIGAAPWNAKHKLVHVGLQGRNYDFGQIEPMNLVFLLDVSGSMSNVNKLPLLKKSYKLLVDKMRPQDRIAIVVYAGAAGLVLPSTPGSDKKTILNALNNLEAGGSTAGGAGIKLAYQIAVDNFQDNGVNRVILATDGDFNVGASSNGEMKRLIESKRDQGVYLTVLGFGMGNYKDSRMETIADNGNGNYFYIDNIKESNKVLVDELGSTLYTIAKDVKLQVEFNPQKVQAYRLIGYANRRLKNEDFNDDKKDAGELGAGHTVTALYEIIPVGVKSEFIKSVDALKYQKPQATAAPGNFGDELLTVKFRYKKPNETKSNLIVHPVKDELKAHPSEDFRFSASVAGFGMLLSDSEFKQNLTYEMVTALAKGSKGPDDNGYRSEFIQLVKIAESLGPVVDNRP